MWIPRKENLNMVTWNAIVFDTPVPLRGPMWIIASGKMKPECNQLFLLQQGPHIIAQCNLIQSGLISSNFYWLDVCSPQDQPVGTQSKLRCYISS
jgi:hypothetical protein